MKVSADAASIAMNCSGGASGRITLELTARNVEGSGQHRRTVTIILGKTVTTLAAGSHRTVKVKIGANGLRLLKHAHTLHATLLVVQAAAGRSRTLISWHLVFHAAA